MNVSIYNQIQQLEKLLRILNNYADNLRYHAITAPANAIEDGLYYGLPEEIASKYRWLYYERNRIDAENILHYIDGVCIPCLENKIKQLEGDSDND